MSLKQLWTDLVRTQRRMAEIQGRILVALEGSAVARDAFAEAWVGGAGTDTYRMFKLLQKNPTETFTMKEMAESLGIDGNRARQAAYVLVKEKGVLTREKRGSYRVAAAYRNQDDAPETDKET